jgi:hypothetical protein
MSLFELLRVISWIVLLLSAVLISPSSWSFASQNAALAPTLRHYVTMFVHHRQRAVPRVSAVAPVRRCVRDAYVERELRRELMAGLSVT